MRTASLLLATALVCGASAVEQPANGSKPSFLFILGDDIGYKMLSSAGVHLQLLKKLTA